MWELVGITPERRPGVRLLDVACGSGVRTFGLLAADPTASVVGIDTAPVIEIARDVAAAIGVAHRVELRPGDAATAEFGRAEFDVVLFSYFLCFFSPERVVELLRRARAALRPGGMVVIHSSVADEERRTAEEALLTAVELLLWMPDSRAHAFSEYGSMLETAGFEAVTRHGDEVISARSS